MVSNHSQQIVQKLWNCCNFLRDDGLSYGDYVEKLPYLLFLKMADERTRPPYNEPRTIPAEPSTTGRACSGTTEPSWRSTTATPWKNRT